MKILLYPFSMFFNIITSIRNWLFDCNILTSESYSVPIICIGNLSVGGTGKTPHADYIINLLKNNYKIAILSRGYGRKDKNLNYVSLDNTAIQVGDEPLFLKQKHKDIIVIVEQNRNKGVKRIIQDHPDIDVILLDDGFQHRWINAKLNILLTSYTNPYFNDSLLPSGNLRESKEGANRANIIIISKCPQEINPTNKKGIIHKLNLFAHQKIYFSTIEYNNWQCMLSSKIIEKDQYSITLVTGIADPEPIIQYLKDEGHTVSHLCYHDHHNYTAKDIKEIITEYTKDKSIKKLILTTEKDATKLIPFNKEFEKINIYVLPINIKLDNVDEFKRDILNYVE